MWRIVAAETPLSQKRVRGILNISITAVVALAALRAVIVQFGIRVCHAILEPVREMLLQNRLECVIHARAQWDATPQNVLILRIFTQCLANIAPKARVREGRPGAARDRAR